MSDDTGVTRKYSVAEIDAMRRSVERMSKRVGGPNGGTDFDIRVEQRLRTYMVAGAAPDEMERAAEEAFKQYLADYEEYYQSLQRYWMRETEQSAKREPPVTPRSPRRPRMFSAEWWG
jgi:hypothetical protein